MSQTLQLLGALGMIAGLLLVIGLLWFLICWLALAIVSYVPMIGRRHRHRDWERLNRGGARDVGQRSMRGL
jgi:hypothetical protein